MTLCLVFTMVPLSAEVAFGNGGESDNVPPTVTFEQNATGSEFYTINYDSQYGWILEVFAGSDTEVCDVIMNYNGKAKKSALKIGKLKQADLVKKGLITVKYSYNMKPGIAKMTIKAGKKAKSKYEGQTTMYFRITPKKMVLTSLTSQKKGKLILKWKGPKYASEYNILISESENFEAEKTYNFTVSADKFNSMSFKEATCGVKYYVKIRSFTDSKYGRSYGAWGKALSIAAK